MTILGTRPEIIRLSRIIPLLDDACEHTLVDTGQNFDDRLSALFFRELQVRKPDVTLCARGASFGEGASARGRFRNQGTWKIGRRSMPASSTPGIR